MNTRRHGLADTPVRSAAGMDEGMDLLEAVQIVLLRKKTVVGFVFAFGILAALAVLWLKPTYTAKATFLPPNSMSASTSLFPTQIAGIGSAGGMLGILKDPSMIYIGVLESREVADDLIQQFHLQNVYKTRKLSQTETALAAHTKFLPAKDSLITISVEDHDPQRAADIANEYLKELTKQNDRLVLTEAGQRRVFFEQQLKNEKDLLTDAEVALTRVEEQTGMIRPGGQTELQISMIAQTQASISNLEIELGALLQGATEQNPEVIRLRSQIAGLEEQESNLENSKIKEHTGNVMVPTSKVPALTLEYVRQQREVQYHEALYGVLLRQYESARLDESGSAPLIQIVDSAQVPDTKSGPHRMFLVLLASLFGGILGAMWVILPIVWARKVLLPENATRLSSLKEAAQLWK